MKVSRDDDIPKIWKVIKVMFQTTNQILMNISMVFDTSRAVTWDQTIRGGDVEVLIMRASNDVFYIRCPEEDV